MNKSILLTPALTAGVSLFVSVSVASAGNKEMVEKTVNELDSLNREVMQQLPGLPRDGHIHIKAGITQSGIKRRIDIIYKEITPLDRVDQVKTQPAAAGDRTEVVPTEASESQETNREIILPDRVDQVKIQPAAVGERAEVVQTETSESQETMKQEINFNDLQQKISPH
ncbi:MAG: hypothetical protein U9O82_04645 [Thermodesulfobacteriota bacterium]|nr:hypothetical protein [Thermodesulfobacteriota bacterium]